MLSLLGVPVDAAYHLVSGLTGILTPVLGGLAATAAIVVFTVAVRLLLAPLSLRALRGQAAAARLAPQLQALRQRYRSQPERLQREMSALYKRAGTSMFAPVIPLLVQWPALSVMYLLYRSPRAGGTVNALLSHDLLGVPLGARWLGGAGLSGALSAHGAVFLGVFGLLAVACWLSARLGRSVTAPAGAGQGQPAAPGGALLGRVLPYLTVVIAAFAPLAAGIYLLTSLAWSLGERWLYGREAGAAKPGGLTRRPACAAAGPAASRAPAADHAPAGRPGRGWPRAGRRPGRRPRSTRRSRWTAGPR